jgi:molybdopterin/thiamine biosynthesis adenylyltransferase
MTAAELSDAEWARYGRQIGPGVLTRQGQQRLCSATVLVTRVGGIGGPAAQALVMAGVGRVIVAHGGTLLSPDLNRQVLGRETLVGRPRMPEFARQLQALNANVTVEAVDHEPDAAEARDLAARADLILSCPPTFEERMLLNEAAVAAGVPLVDAAQWGMTGTLIAVAPGRTACLRCIYPQDPQFEECFPVLGAISAAMGSLAALEAIKILAETGSPLWGRMWIVDGFGARLSDVTLARDPHCRCCGSIGQGVPHAQPAAQGARNP